ncbi:MAG: penicillin-binding protein activator [Pseudomonadota bacterium]
MLILVFLGITGSLDRAVGQTFERNRAEESPPTTPKPENTKSLKIGLSLPLTGRFAAIAKKVEFGAQVALRRAAAVQVHAPEMVLFDDGCAAEKASAGAETFLAAEVDVVIGPLCYQYAKALAGALRSMTQSASTTRTVPPVIALRTRNKDLVRARRVEGLALASLSQAHDGEARAIVDRIFPMFSGRPFALLDDGSVYGRNLTDQLRLLGEERGFKAVIAANFRPLQTSQRALLRRLARSGVEAVFIAASPEDVMTISKDLAALQYDWLLATGETALLLPFTPGAANLKDGLLSVQPNVNPDSLAALGPWRQQLLADGATLETPVLLGFAAMEVALAWRETIAGTGIAGQSDPAGGSGGPPLAGRTFDTVLGPLTFSADGRAPIFPFALMRWENGGFEPATPSN